MPMSSNTKLKVLMRDWASATLGGKTCEAPFADSTDGVGKSIRIIIIGAGAAGLSAGATLKKLMPSANVKLIEARNRIGGRIRTGHLPVETNDTRDRDKTNVTLHKTQCCSVDLGAAYVHGCNVTNPLFRQAVCNKRKLDTSAGGYSIGWGDNCLWRSEDGRVIDKKDVKGAFKLAWSLKRNVESSMLETKKQPLRMLDHMSRNHGKNTITKPVPNNEYSVDELRLKLLEKEDICLRESVDEHLATKFHKRYMQLNEDQKNVLKSSEVLLWSYVASMSDLSTRMLNEISIPASSQKGVINKDIPSDTYDSEEKQQVSLMDPLVADNDASQPDWKYSQTDSQTDFSQPISQEESFDVFSGGGRRSRRKRETFQPEDFIETKKHKSPKSTKDTQNGLDEKKLTWLDGLVSDGYFDLVCAPLSKGLNVELGRIVKEVHWEGKVCRVVSRKNRETSNKSTMASNCDVDSSPTTSPTHSDMSNSTIDQNPVHEEGKEQMQIDECDFVIIALPLGVLKGMHDTSSIIFYPPLPQRKVDAIRSIGFGSENKVILCFPELFWDKDAPYLQTVDERFRILNGHYFGKGNTLVFHTSPPFGKGYDGLSDEQVVEECVRVLRGMYSCTRVADDTVSGHGVNKRVNSATSEIPSDTDRGCNLNPIWSHVTRWDIDPFAMGAYSYWAKDMNLQHVEDIAVPEPEMMNSFPASETSSSCGEEAMHLESKSKKPLIEPKLYFCGEHATIRDAQCVHGACNSGERAARQVACAALGFLDELHECVRKGESFWYETASIPSENIKDESSDASEIDDDPAEEMSGKSILFDVLYSPFPSQEAVGWHQGVSWQFDCPCGIQSKNFDDGASMLQCEGCKTWQHFECAKSYLKVLGKAEEEVSRCVAKGYHCFNCFGTNLAEVTSDKRGLSSFDGERELEPCDFDSDFEGSDEEDTIHEPLIHPEWEKLVTDMRRLKSTLSMTAQTVMANTWIQSTSKDNN